MTRAHSPVSMSQARIVRSSLLAVKIRPSGPGMTAVIPSVCPLNLPCLEVPQLGGFQYAFMFPFHSWNDRRGIGRGLTKDFSGKYFEVCNINCILVRLKDRHSNH